MTPAQALADAARRLADVSETPRLDAELLLAHALGLTRETLLLNPPGEVPPGFDALLNRRLTHEPIAYITGHRAFWTIDLHVRPGILIPRPDSETLIEAALAHFGPAGPARILDLGTGSGALLLAALAQWPKAVGLGVDQSEIAVEIAAANAARLGLAGRAQVRFGDWETAGEGDYDLVLCNPPYVESGAVLPPQVARYEPASALFAGADGLDDYRLIAPLLQLPPGGIACIEIGATQGPEVSALFGRHGFLTEIKRDLAGRDRCLVVSRAS